MKKRFLTSAVAVSVSAAMLMTACGSSSSGDSDSTSASGNDKTITAAMPSAWGDLFPLGEASYYDNIIFTQVYDPLVLQNGDGTFTGMLADSWDVNDASDEITFHLNKDAKWQDGEDFTANDVVASLQMYSDPNVTAASRYFLEYIDGCDDTGVETSENSIAVTANGDDEVVMKLKSPTYVDTVLADLAKVYIVAEHKIKDLSADDINNAETWAEPMGTGAFIYADKVDGERMEFTSNPDYYKGAPAFDKLVIRVVESDNMLAGLMNGEIDTILYGGVPLDDWSMAKEQDNLTCESLPSTNYQMLIINSSKEYMTQEVRQALNLAINREALVKSLLQGEGEAIITPICSLSPYYDKDVTVEYDADKAKEMLEKANFPFDQELVFYVPTGNAVREKAATMIAEDLKAVGVKTKIEQADFSTVMEKLQNGDEDLSIVGSGGTMNPAESLEMLTGSFNLCKLPDDNELVSILKEANSALTMEERTPLFNEYQEKVKEIAPYGYLFTTNSLVAYNSRLGNVKPENFSTFNWAIYSWTIEE